MQKTLDNLIDNLICLAEGAEIALPPLMPAMARAQIPGCAGHRHKNVGTGC
jgi:hypothetical protein